MSTIILHQGMSNTDGGTSAGAVSPVSGPDAVVLIDQLPGSPRAYALHDGSGEHHLLGGMVATVMARAADTGNLFEAAMLTGGMGAALPPHVHARSDEAVFVIDGQVELRLGGDSHLLSRGDYASIPASTLHGLIMRSHRTRLLSYTMGGEAGAIYPALGAPFERPVPPELPGPALTEDYLRAAEATADIRFDRAAVASGPAVPVTADHIPPTRLAYVLRAGEGERLVAGDQLFTFLGTQAVTDGRFITVMTAGPAGKMIPPHFHAEHTENFLCLDGLMTMVVNGQELHLHPGDYLQVPPGHVHAYRLDAPYTRFMGWLAPGLFEPFFRLLGTPSSAFEFPLHPSPLQFGRVMANLEQLDLHQLPNPGGHV